MNNFKTTIGLEIHTVVKSKSKMFSPSRNSHDAPVNTNINEIDLGLPGSMPSPNEVCVKKAIQLAKALNMEISKVLSFDRKNYFYQDLPKGFQITQQHNPIGINGSIDIISEFGETKTINIEKIQLEEDTAKQVLIDDKLCLDYNRCGLPLIEIVSKPDISSAKEAVEYVRWIRRILLFLNISDSKMEDGSLRVDVNISVAPHGQKELGTRVEVKNINSISNIAKAIEFEKTRQIKLLLNGVGVEMQTVKWDDVENKTVYMREKTDFVDYNFFHEPNILEVHLNEAFVQSAMNDVVNHPVEIKKFLDSLLIDEKIVNQLLDDPDLYLFFKYVFDKHVSANNIVTWFLIELGAHVKKDNTLIQKVDKEIIEKIIAMINLLEEKEINSKQAKIILHEIYKNNEEASSIIERLNFKQIKDEKIIENYFVEYFEKNKSILNQVKERPERVEKFFLGLLMKDTKGQANPVVSNNVLQNLLAKHK